MHGARFIGYVYPEVLGSQLFLKTSTTAFKTVESVATHHIMYTVMR